MNGVPLFVTAERFFESWANVEYSLQPALRWQQLDQDARQERNYGESLWTLQARAWVYIPHDPTYGLIPATILNNAMDAIENQLLPVPGQMQDLGGLVEHFYIDGKVMVDEGTVGEDTQGVIMIPLTIRTGI